MKFDYELVGKIGSMALIRRADNDIDYNIFSRLGAELAARHDLGQQRRDRDRPARLHPPQRQRAHGR